MKTFKIFTSGKMGGISYGEQTSWRFELERCLKDLCCDSQNFVFIHPPAYFDYNFPDQNIAKEWEINQIINSDIVVFDLSTIMDSIGTHIEIGVVQAANKTGGKQIYTIGIGTPNTDHPWIQSSMFYNAEDVIDAAQFIKDYLLV